MQTKRIKSFKTYRVKIQLKIEGNTVRIYNDGSLGLVVMGGDFCSEGCEFESHHRILDGHFFIFICCKICNVFWKDEYKRKIGRGWPIFCNDRNRNRLPKTFQKVKPQTMEHEILIQFYFAKHLSCQSQLLLLPNGSTYFARGGYRTQVVRLTAKLPPFSQY